MAAGQGFKTFATGDVLTAADTNGYLMQGVWVFADAAARTAAVTSPEEGNISFLKDTNSTEYYSGAAWVAIGGSSGSFTKIVANTFTTVSSVSLPASTFSATYKNYKVILNITSTSSGAGNITGRMRASGTDDTSTDYYAALAMSSVAAGASIQGTNGVTSFGMGFSGFFHAYAKSLDFYNPEIASQTKISGTGFGYTSGHTAFAADTFGGLMNNSTQYDSFSFIVNTGTMTGSYAVYGLEN
jgi:hypothetical protein